MKRRRILIRISVGILCAVALLLWCGRSPLRPWLELTIFEHQVKGNIDPIELQQWAQNLIVQHSVETESQLQYYGRNFTENTNFPSGLKKVGRFSNGINILVGGTITSVKIFDLSKGGPFMAVGAPSFIYSNNLVNQTVVQWKPGIFFVGQH
jgi:hypothetical protein